MPGSGCSTIWFAAGNRGAGMAEDILTLARSVHPGASLPRVNVVLTAGPTVAGDEWTIAPWYEYGGPPVFSGSGACRAPEFKTTADAASSSHFLCSTSQTGPKVRLGRAVLGVRVWRQLPHRADSDRHVE